MTAVTDLPLWAAIPVCLLLLSGAAIALTGALGLVRMDSFYRRLHTPGLVANAGTFLICFASALTFLVLQNRWIVHEILIVIFVVLTTPVTMMLLGQASLYRDRIERNEGIPAKPKGAPGENTEDSQV